MDPTAAVDRLGADPHHLDSSARKDHIVKSPRTRRAVAALALTLSLGLAGCAQADPSAAARVDGRVVPESDVRTATTELSQLQLPQPLNAEAVTQFLAFGPIFDSHLQKAGVSISDQQIRRSLPNPDTQLSKPSMDALRTLMGLSIISEAQQSAGQPGGGAGAQKQKVLAAGEEALAEMRQKVDSGQIVLNPKYLHSQVDWIQEAPQAAPNAGAPQQ